MKRGELASEELDKVIKLKKIGTSWLKIQNETGINRRTAKRAYEKWEHSQYPEDLREARKDVAAKAFLDHLKSLTTLADAVLYDLSVPSSLDDMETNAEQFFSEMWHHNLLGRFIFITSETTESEHYLRERDRQFRSLENELLFKCLQDHTRGEGVRWEALEEWKKARDNGAKIVPSLREKTSEVVRNLVCQERDKGFLQKLKEETKEKDPVKRMAEVVLRTIWGRILQNKLDEEGAWFETVSPDGTAPVVYVKPKLEVVSGFVDRGLAEKVTHILELTANNLCKGEMVESLEAGVRNMEKATEELRERLNPIRLTPMIIRTRCDLCPA